jgi:hypothetical protein
MKLRGRARRGSESDRGTTWFASASRVRGSASEHAWPRTISIDLSRQVLGHHLKVNSQSFHAGPQATHATNAEQHTIYNKKAGALYYEKSLHSQPEEFAVLDHHPKLNPHDFMMVA